MAYSFIGFNSFNMFNSFPGSWCCGIMPVMSYSYYNPVSVFTGMMPYMCAGWMNPFSSYNLPYYNLDNYFNNVNFALPLLDLSNYSFLNIDTVQNGWYDYKPENYIESAYPVFGSVAGNQGLYLNTETLPELTINTGVLSNLKMNTAVVSKPKMMTAAVSEQKKYSSISSVTPKYTTFNKSYLNKEFLDKVKQVAKNINCDYEDLLALMNSESSLDPAAVYKNKKGEKTAVGLIQFTKNAAIPELNKRYGLNLTIEKIEKMSALEQLDLVEKYYKMHESNLPKGRKLTAADLYAVTFLPAFAKNDVLTRRGEIYYENNKGLDMNGDNKITKSDLEMRIAKKRVNLDTFA